MVDRDHSDLSSVSVPLDEEDDRRRAEPFALNAEHTSPQSLL
jgi:hypothetical protein